MPSNDLVNVEIGKMNLQPFEVDKSYGLYKFRLNLPPNKEDIIKIEYNLNHSTEIQPSFNETGKEW